MIIDSWEAIKQDPNAFLTLENLPKSKKHTVLMNGQMYYLFDGGIVLPVKTYEWLKAQGIVLGGQK